MIDFFVVVVAAFGIAMCLQYLIVSVMLEISEWLRGRDWRLRLK